VIATRDEAGLWKPPMFVEITGANVGWQAGIQGTDLVLVFRTKNSLRNLMRWKFTIGANASAAAGPVGHAAAITRMPCYLS
jgi:SH3 domain-containing YSC84-like protein 1